MKKCKIERCEREIIAVEICNMHYQRKRRTGEYGEAEARKGRLGIDWTDEEARRKYKQEYKRTHPYKSLKAMHKKRFGGMRERVLERDNHTCQICRMTDEEHIKKWGWHITVDHINGKGRNSKEKDHSIDNLRVLCTSCHGRADMNRGD